MRKLTVIGGGPAGITAALEAAALGAAVTPFEDHPAALEHFPSGSLVSPPYENLARTPALSD